MKEVKYFFVVLLAGCSNLQVLSQINNDKAEFFEQLEFIYETNVSDGDTEIVLKVDTEESFKSLSIVSPTSKRILHVNSEDDESIGLSELKIETAEPSNNQVRRAYPEGIYTVIVKSLSDGLYQTKVELSHSIVQPPVLENCGNTITQNNSELKWSNTNQAVKLILEIENDELGFQFIQNLPTTVQHYRILDGLLIPNNEYEISIAAVAANGNIGVYECEIRYK